MEFRTANRSVNIIVGTAPVDGYLSARNSEAFGFRDPIVGENVAIHLHHAVGPVRVKGRFYRTRLGNFPGRRCRPSV